jgi:hypothetical protein
VARWDGSNAQKLVQTEIKTGRWVGLKPHDIWESNPILQDLTLETFRARFYQEKRAKLASNYWLAKKKKNDNKETDKKSNKTKEVEIIIENLPW